jgi:hypothetical protein
MTGRESAKLSEDVILTKLVQLARGDVALVSEAIRAIKRGDDAVDLKAIVGYITQQINQRATSRQREHV